MGHERVLNEDKVAHPDEGMVGIMREIERSIDLLEPKECPSGHLERSQNGYWGVG